MLLILPYYNIDSYYMLNYVINFILCICILIYYYHTRILKLPKYKLIFYTLHNTIIWRWHYTDLYVYITILYNLLSS